MISGSVSPFLISNIEAKSEAFGLQVWTGIDTASLLMAKEKESALS